MMIIKSFLVIIDTSDRRRKRRTEKGNIFGQGKYLARGREEIWRWKERKIFGQERRKRRE